MAGRHRSVALATAGLDDLFEDEDEQVGTVRARRPWLLRAVLPAFAVTAVAYTVSHALGVAPPLLLIVALVTGGFLVREATVRSREPRSRRVRDAVRPRLHSRTPNGAASGGGPAAADGVLTAVATWDRRLERARAAPRHAAALLVTDLGELADERLRQRHGLTRGSDSARARVVLGDAVWSVLHRAGRPPTEVELDAVVRRLEAL